MGFCCVAIFREEGACDEPLQNEVNIMGWGITWGLWCKPPPPPQTKKKKGKQVFFQGRD